MPGSIVAPIRRLCVYAVQLPHPLRQVSLHRFDYEMVVVCHEAESMADPIVAFDYFGQYIQKHFSIIVVFENRLAPIASGGDVVPLSNPRFTGSFETGYFPGESRSMVT